MPIDKMMSDAILGTFRNMKADCEKQELFGEEFDKMSACLARMEELAEQLDDLNEFNGQIAQENLYAKFSDHYGRVLSAQAMADQEEKGYDDKTLLDQTVGALRDAIKRLKDAKQEAIDLSISQAAEISNGQGKGNRQTVMDNSVEIDVLINNEAIIKPIENLIALGEEEGMTLPRFLRIQIEKGMDKAMEGSSVLRDGYEYQLAFIKAIPESPIHIKKWERKIEGFDRLAANSEFGVPNSKELTFMDEDIDYEFEADILKWGNITDRWEDLLWDLSFWSLSYTSMAPYIEPWSMSDNPRQAVIRTQEKTPGLFKQKERLLEKYFGISFMDIFKHPTFEWKVMHHTIGESQEYVNFLIEKVYPQCKPFNSLPSEIISEREAFYKEKREMNPELHLPQQRFAEFYDGKFGEGRYASKYPIMEKGEWNAQPWNWYTFKYKN